jgi:2-(1,2-epoxy-1,2-dihydrophenyl)acetyl-CoA isomerase
MGQYPDCENFVVERDGGIVRFIIDSTTRHNSLNYDMGEELLELAVALNTDDEARCGVLTGTGGAFCAGADIQTFHEDGHGEETVRRGTSILHDAILQFHQADVPVVSAVNGVATGAGLGIALVGDIVLMSDEARFEYAYPRLALPGDGGVTFHLPRLVGLQKAKEIVLLDRPIEPADAADLGLVTEVVPDDEFESRREEVAAELASGPTQALGAAKQLLTKSFNQSLPEQLADEMDATADAVATDDHDEGIESFVESREPEFENR